MTSADDRRSDARVPSTALAWRSLFATYDVAGTAFLDPIPYLPLGHWDIGMRVESLYKIILGCSEFVGQLEVVTDFPAASTTLLKHIHTPEYIASQLSGDQHEQARSGSFAVGAAVMLTREIFGRKFANGYALVRPAGHHAEANRGGGGCIFANGVLAASEAKRLGAQRILYLDWDAHHGNSQQAAFWSDPTVLTISLHQAQGESTAPSGASARGAPDAFGRNINIPLPAGSGGGAYKLAFERVVWPAAARFEPDFVLVSCGFDGNNIDPSGRLRLHSGDYQFMAREVMQLAHQYASGRLLLTHEGGYALSYVPVCFLRVIEAMTGVETGLSDPFLERWGTDFAANISYEALRSIRLATSFVKDI